MDDASRMSVADARLIVQTVHVNQVCYCSQRTCAGVSVTTVPKCMGYGLTKDRRLEMCATHVSLQVPEITPTQFRRMIMAEVFITVNCSLVLIATGSQTEYQIIRHDQI